MGSLYSFGLTKILFGLYLVNFFHTSCFIYFKHEKHTKYSNYIKYLNLLIIIAKIDLI